MIQTVPWVFVLRSAELILSQKNQTRIIKWHK